MANLIMSVRCECQASAMIQAPTCRTARTLAPQDTNNWANARSPAGWAERSGVLYCASALLTSAPASLSVAASAMFPAWHAISSGVLSRASALLRSVPAASST